MSTKNPPKQLYLTFKAITSYDEVSSKYIVHPVPLGFSNEHGTSKANIAKRQTQLTWAYMQNSFCEYEEREDGIWLRTGRWERVLPDPAFLVYTEWTRVEEYLQPKIIDNVPMVGFKIVSSVGRYSTANKLWRVLDPRGFELEISCANLESIINETTITKGVIESACMWRTPKILMLCP